MNNGFVVWLTGIPSSGKTTVAKELTKRYLKKGLRTETLDGDEIRRSLSKDLGFSKSDRQEHIRRVIFVSKLLARNGVAVNVALISPYREFRENAKKEINNFLEVYIKTPLEICITRDTKGLYKKALNGEITDLTGLQSPYEEPLNPDIIIDTTEETPEEAAEIIINKLEENGYIS